MEIGGQYAYKIVRVIAMKKSIVLLLLMFPLLFAEDSIEVGSSQYASVKPFGAVCAYSLRYQVIVDSSEFSEAMLLSSITFFAAPGSEEVTFDEFYIDLGYCTNENLTENFNSNYVNGLKYPVLERTSPITYYYTDPTIVFDTPFFYIPANGNLVLEFAWPGGDGEIFTFASETSSFKSVAGSYDSTTGDPLPEFPHLLINGDLALEQMTFAGLKATFR